MALTVVILTFNEAQHILRAIESVLLLTKSIIVVDSNSDDDTAQLARQAGARVIKHDFVNQASQFNWALTQLDATTEWVLRLDADEYLTTSLQDEIREFILYDSLEISGVYLPRRMTFLGRKIRYGGIFPVRVLRLFRYGKGQCENRWMDEHIVVEGPTIELKAELIDDNLNSLTWWTEKHNRYACREVVDILNSEYGFILQDPTGMQLGRQASTKRWIKKEVYTRMPTGLRALVYFLYRYVIRLGFLDGKEGTAFHVLQGFWYRYLVDTKLYETKSYMRTHGVDAVTAIEKVLGIKI